MSRKKQWYTCRVYVDTISNRPKADASDLEIFTATKVAGSFSTEREALTFGRLLAKGSGQWVEVFAPITRPHPKIRSFNPRGE